MFVNMYIVQGGSVSNEYSLFFKSYELITFSILQNNTFYNHSL